MLELDNVCMILIKLFTFCMSPVQFYVDEMLTGEKMSQLALEGNMHLLAFKIEAFL